MKDKTKFNLCRLGIIAGSSGVIVLLGKLCAYLFTVPDGMTIPAKGVRFFAGSLVALFLCGWLLAIITILLGFDDFEELSSLDNDCDFDQYV